jgi:succinoglycan biosynthesis protein ExoO
VLVVDDASTDGTALLVERLAAQDGRVRLLRQHTNAGPARARNRGLDEARGKWVAVLDADDALLPDRIERLVDIAERERADIIADNFLWSGSGPSDGGEPALPVSSRTEVIDARRFAGAAQPYTGRADLGLLKPVLRRDFLNDHALRYPVGSRHGEDFLFMMDALLAGATFVLDHRPGYVFTGRNGGTSRTRVSSACYCGAYVP